MEATKTITLPKTKVEPQRKRFDDFENSLRVGTILEAEKNAGK
jgi:hypothetical protein